MNDPQDQDPPDASTEAQRRALDEMSRRLEENLNAMVREQNERAHRFAATQHSLSHLPGMPEPSQPQLLQTSAVQQQRQKPDLPPRPTVRKEPERFDAAPLRDVILKPKRPKSAQAADVNKKSEESGCGSGPIITLIVILVIIIRSCS